MRELLRQRAQRSSGEQQYGAKRQRAVNQLPRERRKLSCEDRHGPTRAHFLVTACALVVVVARAPAALHSSGNRGRGRREQAWLRRDLLFRVLRVRLCQLPRRVCWMACCVLSLVVVCIQHDERQSDREKQKSAARQGKARQKPPIRRPLRCCSLTLTSPLSPLNPVTHSCAQAHCVVVAVLSRRRLPTAARATDCEHSLHAPGLLCSSSAPPLLLRASLFFCTVALSMCVQLADSLLRVPFVLSPPGVSPISTLEPFRAVRSRVFSARPSSCLFLSRRHVGPSQS